MKVRFSILNNDGEIFKLASIFPILAKNHKISTSSGFFYFKFSDPRIVAVNVQQNAKREIISVTFLMAS